MEIGVGSGWSLTSFGFWGVVLTFWISLIVFDWLGLERGTCRSRMCAITCVAEVLVLAWQTETPNSPVEISTEASLNAPEEAQLWGPFEKWGYCWTKMSGELVNIISHNCWSIRDQFWLGLRAALHRNLWSYIHHPSPWWVWAAWRIKLK